MLWIIFPCIDNHMQEWLYCVSFWIYSVLMTFIFNILTRTCRSILKNDGHDIISLLTLLVETHIVHPSPERVLCKDMSARHWQDSKKVPHQNKYSRYSHPSMKHINCPPAAESPAVSCIWESWWSLQLRGRLELVVEFLSIEVPLSSW